MHKDAISRDLPTFGEEFRITLRLAAPLAGGSLAYVGMGLTDTVLLGGLGRDALAAGGLGVGIFSTLTMILHGMVSSVGILASHARGGGRHDETAPILRAGFLLATLAAAPLMLLLWWMEPFLRLIGEPAALAHAIARYDRILALGVPASIWLAVQRSFLTAVHRPRVVMIVAVCALLCNGFLNYGLMHGAWGLPEMGYLGSSTATASVVWGMCAATAASMRQDIRAMLKSAFDRRIFRDLAVLGLPIGGTFGVEILFFTAGGLMAGILGATALAAHQVALSVASTTFMVPMSIAQAANVRVGFHMGANRPRAARQAGFASFVLGVGFMALTAVAMFTMPRQIALLFNLDPGDAADAAVIALVIRLLGIAAIFQVVDGGQTIAAGALRGFKDTRVPMMLAAFGYWAVGFPAAWGFAFPFGWGAIGIWVGFAVGLGVTAVVLGGRFLRVSRRALIPAS